MKLAELEVGVPLPFTPPLALRPGSVRAPLLVSQLLPGGRRKALSRPPLGYMLFPGHFFLPLTPPPQYSLCLHPPLPTRTRTFSRLRPPRDVIRNQPVPGLRKRAALPSGGLLVQLFGAGFGPPGRDIQKRVRALLWRARNGTGGGGI